MSRGSISFHYVCPWGPFLGFISGLFMVSPQVLPGPFSPSPLRRERFRGSLWTWTILGARLRVVGCEQLAARHADAFWLGLVVQGWFHSSFFDIGMVGIFVFRLGSEIVVFWRCVLFFGSVRNTSLFGFNLPLAVVAALVVVAFLRGVLWLSRSLLGVRGAGSASSLGKPLSAASN